MVLARDVGHQSHEAPEAERRKLLVSQAQEGEESVGKAAELQRGARLLQLRRLAQGLHNCLGLLDGGAIVR